MGLFSRNKKEELPELIEAGDVLIGRQATDRYGHSGKIDLVYRYPDGRKQVDIRNDQGQADCGLDSDEYALSLTYYIHCDQCSGKCTGH